MRGAPFVLAFSTTPFAGYGSVQDMAKGIDRALEELSVEDRPLALVFVHNIGQVVGSILSAKWNMPCIDEVSLSELDFIDIGEVVPEEGFVPVVIKSLALAYDSMMLAMMDSRNSLMLEIEACSQGQLPVTKN